MLQDLRLSLGKHPKATLTQDAWRRDPENDGDTMSDPKLQLFLDYTPTAVAMLDREMRYVSASRRWLDSFKLDSDIVGRSHYDAFPHISEGWKTINRRALAGEVLSAGADRFERADGSIYWVRWDGMCGHGAKKTTKSVAL